MSRVTLFVAWGQREGNIVIHMLSRFNLRQGVNFESIRLEYEAFVQNLKASDLIVGSSKIGRRITDSPMDTDEDGVQEFYSVMTFRNRMQLDASYVAIQSGQFGGAKAEPHTFIKTAIRDAVFTCWEVEDA